MDEQKPLIFVSSSRGLRFSVGWMTPKRTLFYLALIINVALRPL
jgi:hypothetical protein